MGKVKEYITANDNRFYGIFLLSMVAFFGIISTFWMFAVSGFIVSGIFLFFYHTIIKRKSIFS